MNLITPILPLDHDLDSVLIKDELKNLGNYDIKEEFNNISFEVKGKKGGLFENVS